MSKSMVKEIISAGPSSGGIQWEDLHKKLLVIEPLELEKAIKTAFGDNDAVRANVYVLTGPDTHDDFEDTLIFPRVLIGQLRRNIGSVVVGRLTQGEAKRGQSAPWMLAEATDKDLEKARAFFASLSVSSAKKAPAADDEDDFAVDNADTEDAY